MPTAAQDLAFLLSGVEEVEKYLLSAELYWPLSGAGSLPRLTIGGLLLAERRLQARELDERQAAQLTDARNRLEVARHRWRSAWETKCRREVRARLDLWKNFLEDYRQSPETFGPEFPRQVQWRVLLHLLLKELPPSLPERRSVEEFDALLKLFWVPDSFVWEAVLAPAFPADEFWFLYGKLKS